MRIVGIIAHGQANHFFSFVIDPVTVHPDDPVTLPNLGPPVRTDGCGPCCEGGGNGDDSPLEQKG